ncbi:MAG: hypothetical protein WCK92_15895 [Bacteroidota bacterium]
MEQMDTFGYMLDEIFYPIEDYSKIVIDYQANEERRNEEYCESFTVISVNGSFDPQVFSLALELLYKDLMSNIKKKLFCLARSEWPEYLDSAIRRLKQLKTIIRCVEPSGELIDTNWENPRKSWVFDREPGTVNRDSETVSALSIGLKGVPAEVLVKTSMYAYCWRKRVKEYVRNMEFLRYYYLHVQEVPMVVVAAPAYDSVHVACLMGGSAEGSPAKRKIAACSPMPEKIKVHRSVPQMAGYLWLLHRNGVFGNMPKTELCRKFAAFFQTSHREEISEHSLKNHFDSPSEEVLQFLRGECHLMVSGCT